ncbi:hypothetical protein CCACVL1_00238 [Corchorus capsularis]|uniref:Uncharacterized protein n=1 Tax=Corchorus capsularis TaxID=210143 RepID=A0A1R3KXK7_COCAP|nr:hypothetical protein CCACVL1_00238 [Corchorus capsularis]
MVHPRVRTTSLEKRWIPYK